MKLVVTILEETAERAIEAIRAVQREHDMVEVRAERFPSVDLQALRNATAKPIILTYRNRPIPNATEALAAGIDFVDVEWREGVEIDAPERTVLSHHDYDGMRDVGAILAAMRARNCAYTKLAATPSTFAENQTLLTLLQDGPATVIGMGERGLYTRVLAPFLGSELAFVAGGASAAPGQLTHERALDIYGREPQQATRVFAIAGNPAGHSLSPSIHNRLFREKGLAAAYTIASFETFEEIAEGLLRGEPCGLSVTTPFKDAAYAFALARAEAGNAEIGENARRARAVNTLVNVGGRIVADNTDVDGFAALIPKNIGNAAILGAGGTARAARVALENAGIPSVRFNRTASKADAPLAALALFEGDLVINTLPAGVRVVVPPCRLYIEAAYGASAADVEAEQRIGGLELLHAQAVRQHELFLQAIPGTSS